jgi:hypothetical protein
MVSIQALEIFCFKCLKFSRHSKPKKFVSTVDNDTENEDMLNDSIEKIIKEFVEVISELADKLLKTKFVIGGAIQRPTVK